MADLVNLWSESGRNIISDDSTPTITLENQSTGAALTVNAIRAGSTIHINPSGASTTLFKVGTSTGFGYVSTNSGASLSYALKIDVNGVTMYVPVYLGVA
jgi:hypothetical protein